jgi:hypothetical protein
VRLHEHRARRDQDDERGRGGQRRRRGEHDRQRPQAWRRSTDRDPDPSAPLDQHPRPLDPLAHAGPARPERSEDAVTHPSREEEQRRRADDQHDLERQHDDPQRDDVAPGSFAEAEEDDVGRHRERDARLGPQDRDDGEDDRGAQSRLPSTARSLAAIRRADKT